MCQRVVAAGDDAGAGENHAFRPRRGGRAGGPIRRYNKHRSKTTLFDRDAAVGQEPDPPL
jgi:hypothetical protein